MNNIEAGMMGQREAEHFLLKKGLRILDRNYRINSGEIDLIALDGECVVFVEVKYRANLNYGYPREAVTLRKQKHIRQTALYYIQRKRLFDCGFRFDVVEVLGREDGPFEITHIENAFM